MCEDDSAENGRFCPGAAFREGGRKLESFRASASR